MVNKHMKKMPTYLVIREMWIKTTVLLYTQLSYKQIKQTPLKVQKVRMSPCLVLENFELRFWGTFDYES